MSLPFEFLPFAVYFKREAAHGQAKAMLGALSAGDS